MEPQIAFLEFLIGKSPSSTIWGTVSNPKYGVIKRAIPMIQPGIPFTDSNVVVKIFPKFSRCQWPENRRINPVRMVTVILQNSIPAWAFTRNCTFWILIKKYRTKSTAAHPTMGQVPRFKPSILFTQVIIAITTAGGTEIHAAIISQEARKPTCLLIPTVL